MIVNSIYIATLLGLALAGSTDGGSTAGNSPAAFQSPAPSGITVVRMIAGDEFTSEEGRFSIILPPGYTEPEESVSPMATENGSVDLKMYTSTFGNTAAMVAFANMDGKVEMQGHEKAMLDGARDNVLKTMHGALLKKEKAITIDGHPGRRLLMSMKPSPGTKLYGRLEMFLVRPIMYQVFYIADKQKSLETPAVNSFFTSFMLR